MSDLPDVPDAGGADVTDVDQLAAALRADAADIDVYARVLTGSLAAAFPPGMVTVQRDRSLGDRMAGRPGTVRLLRIDAGETSLLLEAGRSGVPVARVARAVRGVVISTKDITVADWVRLLAETLAERARSSAEARAALAHLIGSS